MADTGAPWNLPYPIATDLVTDGAEAIQDLAEAVGTALSSAVPAGSVLWFGANTAPSGFLKCNGAAVSRTTYDTLFTAIGTTFGTGDGSTTFNVPDLRGEFVRGWDDSRGVDSGRTFGSAQSDQNKAHTHTVGGALGDSGGAIRFGFVFPTTSTNTGSSGGNESRPRNVALLACIKF